jgi:hypothetical protein
MKDIKDLLIEKQEELIKLLDDCNFSTMVSKEEWLKRKELYNELAILKEQVDNTFSGQTPSKDSLVNLESYSKTEREYTFGEEPPLELKICTRCGKEFKSNVDCPICPSCYL